MTQRLPIILFTNDSLQSKILADALAKRFSLAAVIVQKRKPSQSSRLAVKVLQNIFGNEMLERILIYTKPQKHREALLLEKKLVRKAENFLTARLLTYQTTEWTKVPIIFTENINDSKTEEKIKLLRPALMVVWGTGIIKPNIIALPSIGIINAHPSILPKYKGSFPEFWQCYEDDVAHTGITFHFIDEKVDAGPVIKQTPYKDKWPIDPYTLKSINILSILEQYPNVIEQVLSGSYEKTVQQKSVEKTFRFKDITWEKKHAIFEKLHLA